MTMKEKLSTDQKTLNDRRRKTTMKEKVFAQLYSIVRQEREGHLENLPAHSCDFSRELAGLYLYYLILCLRLFAHPISSVTTGKFLTHPCLQARNRVS